MTVWGIVSLLERNKKQYDKVKDLSISYLEFWESVKFKSNREASLAISLVL